MKLLPVVVLSTVALLSGPVRAATDDGACDACGKPTAWDDFNATDLKLTMPGQPGYASWRVEFDKSSSDIQVAVEMSDGDKTLRGRIMMVGGRVMATQGPITQPGAEIDALDEPILMRVLLGRVLGRALPGGPAGMHGIRSIDFTDAKTGIQFATPSAQGYVAPPWSVRGTIDVASPDRVSFDLAVTGAKAGDEPAFEQRFGGSLGKSAKATIDDATSLEGWSLFGVGVQTRKDGDSTMFDYGAGPAHSAYKTVVDIRRELAAEDDPGKADPKRDFTGFWKEKCDQAFGLQIMPLGSEGKYSVVFCGPGGCGKPGEDGRSTFINGDSHYVIVSDDEIKIRGRGDEWDVYHRCTKDTHPVLQYSDTSHDAKVP